MTNKIVVPNLGEGIKTAAVIAVKINQGDSIEVGQTILELETDKATTDINSEVSGVVQTVAVKVGDNVGEGHVVAILEEGKPAEPAKAPQSEKTKPAESQVSESSQDVVLNNLGEGIKQASVIKVLIKPGEVINDPEQTVAEFETDKATMEFNATKTGKVEKVYFKVGDNINIGEKLFSIIPSSSSSDSQSEAIKSSADTSDQKKSENKSVSGGKTLVSLENLGDGIQQATVIKVLISEGQELTSEDTSVAEVETDKATVEVPAGKKGKVLKVLFSVGSVIKIGDPIFEIESTHEAMPTKAEEPSPAKPSPSAAEKTPAAKESPSLTTAAGVPNEIIHKKKEIIPASPLIRRLARELGVDVAFVKGSGKDGRILAEDVQNFVKNLLSNLDQKTGTSKLGSTAPLNYSEPPLPDFAQFGTVEILQLNKIKQVTAQQMSLCNRVIPQVTQFDEADITSTESTRVAFKAKAEAAGVKLTMTALLTKAAAIALKQYPNFNSSLDSANNQLIQKKFFNIGIAVDTPNGLLVPVIKNADKKSVSEIARDLGEISAKAKARKLSPADMSGATFTLSNLGGISGTGFTPIVNWPEVGILGISKSFYKPVYNGKEFTPRLIMPLSLSYDHRVIDGAEAARFLKYLCEIMAEPFSLSFF